jgi:hypothetical protein
MISWEDPLTMYKIAVVAILYSFLPFTFLTYLLTRRSRRKAEVDRILSLLGIDDPNYKKAYAVETGYYYLAAFAYVSLVTCAGLAVLFLPAKIGLVGGEFPAFVLSDAPTQQSRVESAGEEAKPPKNGAPAAAVKFPHTGSRLVFGMAFLGAYLWGLQYLFRRYSLNDLLPSVYYSMSVRMILAAILAVVIFNAGKALAGDDGGSGGITDNIWPTLAFVLGMFPQRGLRWLTEHLPIFSAEADSWVRKMPLEMIEGMEAHDVLRLEEQGIDSCYDLATADFIPLILKTPYSARQVIDWILQAKLCMCVGDAIKDLRKNGIRTILDLQYVVADDGDGKVKDGDDKVTQLVMGTAVTETAIRQAQASLEKNKVEIERLQKAGTLLGTFWHD